MYKSKEEKATRLGYALISNQAFVDVNKWIRMYVTLVFLEVNGIRVSFTNDEVISMGFKVAESRVVYEEFLEGI